MGTIKTIPLLLGAMLLFGCFRKKKQPSNLADWLEEQFPSRFEVIDTQISDPIRHMSFKVKKSVVAEKNDPDVQFVVSWDARSPNLDLSAEAIDSLAATAQKAVADARAWHQALKAAGLERVSTAVRGSFAYALVYDHPDAAQRQRVLSQLQKAHAGCSAVHPYDLSLHFMDSVSAPALIPTIAPLSYWEQLNTPLKRQTILDLVIAQGQPIDPDQLDQSWVFNSDSDLILRWSDEGRKSAAEWARKHLKKPVQLLDTMEYEALPKTFGVRMKYPFTYDGGSSEVGGYLVGEMTLAQPVLQQIRLEEE